MTKALIAMIAIALLSSCQTNQPYGEDVWIGYKHFEETRK